MQIVLTQGFRAGMEPAEPTSPGPCQQECDPCEQGTGRALEPRAGLDRDIYREIGIYINPPLLGSRMEAGQCGACIALVPAGSTCHLQEGRLLCLSSRSSSPKFSAQPQGRAGRRAAPAADRPISKGCPFTKLFAAHPQVFDFLISWKFNLWTKSRPPLPTWHQHGLMPCSAVIKAGGIFRAAPLPPA